MYIYTVEPLTNDHPHQRPSLSYDHILCDGQCFLFVYESLTSDHPSYTTTPMWFWGWSYKRGSTVQTEYTLYTTPKYQYLFRAILGWFSKKKNLSETWTHSPTHFNSKLGFLGKNSLLSPLGMMEQADVKMAQYHLKCRFFWSCPNGPHYFQQRNFAGRLLKSIISSSIAADRPHTSNSYLLTTRHSKHTRNCQITSFHTTELAFLTITHIKQCLHHTFYSIIKSTTQHCALIY